MKHENVIAMAATHRGVGVSGNAELDGPHPWLSTRLKLYGTSWATWSPCTAYRYTLGRTWDASLRRLVFVGLNPSTACAHKEDPTIAKLIGYAVRWGLGGLDMLNFFAFRSTDPYGLPTLRANGDDNDAAILNTFEVADKAGDTLALGWGNHAMSTPGRRARSRWLIDEAHALHGRPQAFGFNANGSPVHPLYQKNAATLRPVPR